MAASRCIADSISPKEASAVPSIRSIQLALQQADHYIHGLPYKDPRDIAPSAAITASSVLRTPTCESESGKLAIDEPKLLQFPVVSKTLEKISVLLDARLDTSVAYRLYSGVESGNTIPGVMVFEGKIDIEGGPYQWIDVPTPVSVGMPGWMYLELLANDALDIYYGDHPPIGIAGFGVRKHDPIRPNPYSGWSPLSRNDLVRKAFCMRITPEQPVYGPENVTNSWTRPWRLPHLWSSQETGFAEPEWLSFEWDSEQPVGRIDLMFDSSLDFTFYQGWRRYDRNAIPSLVKDYRIEVSTDGIGWRSLVEVDDNYLRHRSHRLSDIRAKAVRIKIASTRGYPRAHIYSVRMYRTDVGRP